MCCFTFDSELQLLQWGNVNFNGTGSYIGCFVQFMQTHARAATRAEVQPCCALQHAGHINVLPEAYQLQMETACVLLHSMQACA